MLKSTSEKARDARAMHLLLGLLAGFHHTTGITREQAEGEVAVMAAERSLLRNGWAPRAAKILQDRSRQALCKAPVDLVLLVS